MTSPADVPESSAVPAGGEHPAALGFELPDNDWLRLVGKYQSGDSLGSLGEYRLEAELGRGGQGIVYRAVEPRTGRTVAIKRVRADLGGSNDLQTRFANEVRAAAALKHPNIVTVYGSEEFDGAMLMAMEYVEGVPVNLWAAGDPDASGMDSHRRPPQPVQQILRLFAKICDAVGHAHQRGVIHRDLKPSNVLVDAQGEPHVLDFGLARVFSEGESAQATLTAGFVGTPAFAAPEQFGEGDGTVDVRSDVYSIGCMLFQSLTGRLPHGAGSALVDIVEAIRHRDPALPSSLRRGLNPEIDAIVLKALAKTKAERYRSVDALADDVRRYLSGQAVLAHPPTALYQFRKLIRRHRQATLMATVALGALVALTVVTIIDAATERELRKQAEQAMFHAQTQERIAQREGTSQRDTAEFLMQVVDNIGRMSYGRTDLSVRTLAEWIAQPLANESSQVRPDIRMRLHRRVSDVFYAVHDYDAANQHDLSAIELARQHYGPEDREVADGLASLAANLNKQGDFAEAERHARTAIEILEKAHVETTGLIVMRYLADALIGQDSLANAEPILQMWVDGRDHSGADAQGRLEARLSLGSLQRRMRKWDAARGTLKDAIRIAVEAGNEDGNFALQIRQELGVLECSVGNLVAAEDLLGKVAEGRVRKHGLKYFRTSDALRWHGLVLYTLGQNAKAAERFEQALVWQERDRRADALELAEVHFHLAAALLADGRVEEGRRHLLRAVSRGKASRSGEPKWDATADEVEAKLRENGWRIDTALRDRLGKLSWLIASIAAETAADRESAVIDEPNRNDTEISP